MHGLKNFKWPDNFLLIAKGLCDHDVVVRFFSFTKTKNFGIIGKII